MCYFNFEIFNSIITFFLSGLALCISYKSYKLANLKPEFELRFRSNNEYIAGYDMTIINKKNNVVNMTLYGSKIKPGSRFYLKGTNWKLVDLTRPSSEFTFHLVNKGRVSAENTKIIFLFNGISLNPDSKNIEKENYRLEYKPEEPITELSQKEMHFIDKDILYPALTKEFVYWFSDAIIFEDNPYIDIIIVSKTSVKQTGRINIIYKDLFIKKEECEV